MRFDGTKRLSSRSDLLSLSLKLAVLVSTPRKYLPPGVPAHSTCSVCRTYSIRSIEKVIIMHEFVDRLPRESVGMMRSAVVEPADCDAEAARASDASMVSPGNFHQAAHAVVLDDAQSTSIRCLALFSSAGIVLAQLVVLMAAYRSTFNGACLTNVDCPSRGTFCRPLTSQCATCRFGTASCGPNVTPEDWIASLPARFQSPDMTTPDVTSADFAPHCAACVDTAGHYVWASTVMYNHVCMMGWRDWVGITLVSAIIGLFVAREVGDIKLCEALARSRSAGSGWQLSVGLISAVRISVVMSLETSVIISVFFVGGGVLTVCLNAVALLFLIEIDDLLYKHIVPEPAKAWSCMHASVMLSAADARVISCLRIAYALKFMICIPSMVAMRLRLPTEVEDLSLSTTLWSVAIPGMIVVAVLIEPLSLSRSSASCHRLGVCLLRFVAAMTMFVVALQLIG